MKWLTFRKQTAPGFRLNITDILFILFLGILSAALAWGFPELSLWGAPLYLGFSFFLFCNVFRIGNRLEPFWYLPFLCVTVYAIHLGDIHFFWMAMPVLMEPLKWILIGYHVWRRPYRGIGHRWVNRHRSAQVETGRLRGEAGVFGGKFETRVPEK